MSNTIEQLDDFRITQPKAIGSVLCQLMARKDFLTVQCSDRPYRIVTRILEVDHNAGLFIYDCSAERAANQCLLESQENYFSATQEGVRIQFVGGRPERHEFEGAPAFRSALPQSLYRMQRREFFRVDTPLADPYRCTAKLPDKRQVVFAISDLSLNGVGLRAKDPVLEQLALGTLLSKAVLDFRKGGVLEVDLKITYQRTTRAQNVPIYHFGCHFENFPRSKESDLQRLITNLEFGRRGRRD